MRAGFDLALLILGMTGAIVFGLYPFMTQKYVYQHWAKLTACMACISGVVWGTLGLVLYHSTFALSRDFTSTLRHTKAFFALLCIGIIAVVLIVRPCRKRSAAKEA
jgi:hypothetical protein